MTLVELATAIDAQKAEMVILNEAVVKAENDLETLRKEHQNAITVSLVFYDEAVAKVKEANSRLTVMYAQMREFIAAPPIKIANEPSELKKLAMEGQKFRSWK